MHTSNHTRVTGYQLQTVYKEVQDQAEPAGLASRACPKCGNGRSAIYHHKQSRYG